MQNETAEPPVKPKTKKQDSSAATVGKRGGYREGAGRKSEAVEKETAGAHILYAKARAKREAMQAQLAELDYKIRSGEYVARADVQQASATAFATIAQSLRSIPDNLERRLNVSPEIAEDVGLLIDDAMNSLADALERIGGGLLQESKKGRS